jgi:hypothetical protein
MQCNLTWSKFMGDAKKIIVKPISAKDGNRIVQGLHYSGKTVQNSQLHLGVFMDGKCGGAMQFGPSLDKRKMLGLVEGTLWNEFIELNRMAFADWLPRNGESRAIGYAFRWMRKQYPQIKWCVSFADGTQCGDGTIYRASGFALTAINQSMNLAKFGNGQVIHKMTLESNPTQKRPELNGLTYYELTSGKYNFAKYVAAVKGVVIPGFQLRYIYFLDPTARQRLTVPILPFSEIDRRGAGMYKGQPRVRSVDSDTSAIHAEMGGANPTRTLSISSPASSGQHPGTVADPSQ